MRKIYLLGLIAILFVSCKNVIQESIQAEEKYKQEAILFLKSVYGKELSNNTLLLEDRPQFKYPQYLMESRYFTDLEKFKINKQIEHPKIKKWEDVFAQKVKYITSDTMRMAFRDLHSFDFWTYVCPNIDKGVRSISAPIFIKDYKYCIFYSDTSYVRLKENRNISLYKKINHKWTLFRKIHDWKKE